MRLNCLHLLCVLLVWNGWMCVIFTAIPGLVIAPCILNVPAVHNLWCILERERRFSELRLSYYVKCQEGYWVLNDFQQQMQKAWIFLLVYFTFFPLLNSVRIFTTGKGQHVKSDSKKNPKNKHCRCLRLYLTYQFPATFVYSIHSEGGHLRSCLLSFLTSNSCGQSFWGQTSFYSSPCWETTAVHVSFLSVSPFFLDFP